MIRCDVAIVGGGFSGTMVAAHLARDGAGLTARLFEENEVGRGAAYGTPHRQHLLNTRASAMSAYPDEPDHFLRWLGPGISRDAFVSRSLYGDYVAEIARRTFIRSSFEIVPNRVVSAVRCDGVYVLATASGTEFVTNAVVLATGNGRPNDDFLPPELLANPGYVGDPWRFDFSRVGGHVLLVGSGLTALDVLVALESAGHRGVVHVVSRRAQFPQAHAEGLKRYDVVPVLDATGALSLSRSFRRQLREAARRGFDWRAVVDAVRPEGEALWKRLSAREQRRFDRHVRSIWERYRHRVPDAVDAVRRRYARAGRLFVHAGTIAGFRSGAVSIAMRGGQALTIHADWMVNCTGLGRGRRVFGDPLIAGLVRDGYAVPEQLGMGIRLDGAGAVLDASGSADGRLWAVGPLARGSRFESTAVPELRDAAQTVARSILESIATERRTALAEA
jgi:uncharacterized NAD(P)/FAD-binding protein YdhS